MAVVWAAWQEELDRPVAVKVLAEHLAGDPEFRARFLREARIASRLQHPNLVRVYDIVDVDGLPSIVMELVVGTTLEGSRVTLDEAAQIAEGLAHAHANGVVHRDLKPGNLIRREDGVVKIADFGIARAAEETRLTQVGTVLGTLRYLAPEQAQGRDVGPEADVYSLAVVLDELLDREPRAVRKALDRARSPNPRDRPTAAELAQLLREHASGAATEAPTAATIALRRHTARRFGAVIAAALLLAAVAIGLAVSSSGGNDAKSPPPAAVRPVPHSDDTTQQAKNLTAWLRRYSAQ